MRNPNVEPTISAVPISLYRELCSELQEKSGEINALQLKNQHILNENQQLRQELQRLVQMVMHTHHQVSQISSSETLSSPLESINPNPQSPLRQSLKPTSGLNPNHRMLEQTLNTTSNLILNSNTPKPEEWITGTHQPLAQRLLQQSTTMARELRGWRLALIISLIILSAFGAGFLIVRPLINSQKSHR